MKENNLYKGDGIFYHPLADDGRRGYITAENQMLNNKNIDYHGGVTGLNPNSSNNNDDDDDGLGVDLQTEIKWLRNANLVNLQEKRELHEKINNYKKFIKMLLEDL